MQQKLCCNIAFMYLVSLITELEVMLMIFEKFILVVGILSIKRISNYFLKQFINATVA